MNVLSVDPGGTTGMAYWSDGAVSLYELPFMEALDLAWIIIASPEYGTDLVVCESFTITQNTVRKSRDGKMSIESIGALRWQCRKKRVPFETQMPADATAFSTDEKLKLLGWWDMPHKDHGRSALRHLLLCLARHRLVDLRKLVVE